MLKHEGRLQGVDERIAAVVRMLGTMTDVEVICGVRTQEEQDAIYAAGKSKNKVSKHTPKPLPDGDGLGKAVDLGVVVGVETDPDGKRHGGKVSWDIKLYLPMLELFQVCAHSIGVTARYGHTWTTNPDDKPARFDDAGHIELL